MCPNKDINIYMYIYMCERCPLRPSDSPPEFLIIKTTKPLSQNSLMCLSKFNSSIALTS